MLRVFLVADGRGDYRVMPGGLARIAGDDREIVSGQRGGSSKDTWVLSDAPVERVLAAARTPAGPTDIARSERAVSSRAGRAPVLARPLRRAQRERGAPAARRAVAPADSGDRQRLGASSPCRRRHLPPARVCCRPTATSRGRSGARRHRARRSIARHRATLDGSRSSLAFNVAQTAARGRRRARSPVVGQLAAPQPARRRRSAAAAGAPRRLATRSTLHRSRDHLARRRRRPRDGAHDARRRLALPEPRAAPRAAARSSSTTVGGGGAVADGRATRRCSSGCSTCPTASSPTAPATCGHAGVARRRRPAAVRSRTTRARPRSSSRSSRSTSPQLPGRRSRRARRATSTARAARGRATSTAERRLARSLELPPARLRAAGARGCRTR